MVIVFIGLAALAFYFYYRRRVTARTRGVILSPVSCLKIFWSFLRKDTVDVDVNVPERVTCVIN